MALPIRQRLSAITCLKAGPKAVLIEVCELAENAGRGCFASNDTLAKKLGVSLATVTRTIASLVSYGLLSSRVVAAEANRRYLAPTAAVMACYKGGTEAEQLAAVAGLTIVKSEPAPGMTIVKNDADYSQNGKMTIVKNDADYSQNASRVIGDDQDDQLESQDDQRASLRYALATAENELGLLKKKCQELEAENARLKANAQASHTKGAGDWKYDPTDIHPGLHLPFDTPGFRQMWVAYKQYREEQKYTRFNGGMSEQEALRHLGNLAAGDEEAALEIIRYSIRGNYKTLCKQDVRRPATQQTTGAPQRGAKPTGTGALGARAAAEHFAALDATRTGTSVHVLGNGAATGFNPS